MPGSPVEQEQDGLWIEHQQDHQETGGGGIGLLKSRQRHFTTIAQIQGAIEMNTLALWVNGDDGRVSARCPHMGQSGLKVQAHFIQCQDHPVGIVLKKVHHFFSSSASKLLMVCSSGFERYTASACW